jgi:hypothetical protein
MYISCLNVNNFMKSFTLKGLIHIDLAYRMYYICFDTVTQRSSVRAKR